MTPMASAVLRSFLAVSYTMKYECRLHRKLAVKRSYFQRIRQYTLRLRPHRDVIHRKTQRIPDTKKATAVIIIFWHFFPLFIIGVTKKSFLIFQTIHIILLEYSNRISDDFTRIFKDLANTLLGFRQNFTKISPGSLNVGVQFFV